MLLHFLPDSFVINTKITIETKLAARGQYHLFFYYYINPSVSSSMRRIDCPFFTLHCSPYTVQIQFVFFILSSHRTNNIDKYLNVKFNVKSKLCEKFHFYSTELDTVRSGV